jgi:hypothetical protein
MKKLQESTGERKHIDTEEAKKQKIRIQLISYRS